MEKIKSIPTDKQAMIDKWRSGGKKINQYCLEENIGYHKMNYWMRKEKYLSSGGDKKFIKVKLKAPTIGYENKTELILSNGNRIIFHGHVNMDDLKQLSSTRLSCHAR